MANEQASWYWRSDEQIAAYKAIGRQHPDQVFDKNYDEFMMKTAKSPAELNQIIIHGVCRVLTQSGEEFLTYGITERRFDGLGNEHSFFRSNIGMYHVPIPEYRLRKDEFGYEEKYVHGIKGRRVAYSIPFDKKNAEKLRKQSFKTEKEAVEAAAEREKLAESHKVVPSYTGANSIPVTRYALHKAGQRGSMYIDSYSDWLTGDFETLWRFGHANPTKEEIDDLNIIDRRTSAISCRMRESGHDQNVNPNQIREQVRDELNKEKEKEAGREPYK